MYIGQKVKINRGKIKLGQNVSIRPYCDIFCQDISIGDNVDIGTRNRFDGIVVIEDNVLIGPDNYISNVSHNYDDINVPIINQGASYINKNGNNKIIIGEGSWIGTHCAIIGDVKIGKHCVIGANSVVTHDVPDYSLVAGSPAKIIKQYNFNEKRWIKYNGKDNR